MGGYILAELTEAGDRPAALSRACHRGDMVDWIQGDLAAPEMLPPITAETVFCTVNVALLADALPRIDTASIKCVVAFSSTSVATKIDSEIESERTLLSQLAEGEQRLIAFCERQNIRWIILRPTLIYAEGRDGNVTRLARFIKRFGFLPLMGRGLGLRQPVHAQDLARGAIKAAVTGSNRIYALPGGDTVSYREMVRRIFDALRMPPRIIPVPPFVWELAFALARPWFPNANVAMGKRMAKDMVFDPAFARQDFDWTPRGFHPDFRDLE